MSPVPWAVRSAPGFGGKRLDVKSINNPRRSCHFAVSIESLHGPHVSSMYELASAIISSRENARRIGSVEQAVGGGTPLTCAL